jgi:hypothetical protein
MTSAYLLDVDEAVAARFPGSAPRCVHRDEAQHTEYLPLAGVIAAVGRSARLQSTVAGGGTVTMRATTTVLAIEPLTHSPSAPT